MYRGENRKILMSKIFSTTRKVIIYTTLVILALVCCSLLYIVFVNSSRGKLEFSDGFAVLPSKYFISNMKGLFSNRTFQYYGNIGLALRNSLIIAFSTAVLACYFSTWVAYGIHMYRFKLRNVAFTFILIIMMIPSQVATVGFYKTIYKLKLTNNFLPLILPAIASPITFFYIKQYMESVLPFEMIEAARVDGANEFRSFHQIVLPVIKPALAVQFIFSFVASWNNYFLPQLLLTSSRKMTLPIFVARIRTGNDGYVDLAFVNSAILFAIIPVTVVYLIFSKFIIKGLTLGAVKG